MTYPKYIKATDGQIGTYAYLTLGNRPVYRFEQGEPPRDGVETVVFNRVGSCREIRKVQDRAEPWAVLGALRIRRFKP